MTYGGTVVKRRMPKVRDLAPLIRFRKPQLDRIQRRLDDAQTIHDLRRLAKRRTPRAAFDYADGAAEDEISLGRARQAFRDIEF
ncbi:MAG TPA: alpha-hydroxy-acid oxidizing enzyme, partial [Mycobacterium sp.]